ATPFISSVMTSRIAPAAAAFAWNFGSGRETQLNIWIGMAVNPLLSDSKLRNGNSPVTGDGGRNAMKLSAPIVMIGAVSPMARDRPRIRPVRIPPVEYGSPEFLGDTPR